MTTSRNACLHFAVLAAIAGQAGPAAAVHLSPNGQGQVLIYPYYTARAGYNTLITVTNTQDNTKALRVRFLEGKNGREVLDFNLFLGSNDVWTGAVVATTAGARLVSNDNSCVTPSDLFAERRTDSQGLGLNNFKNYAYTGTQADSATSEQMTSLDRTREGYFEILEMAVIEPSSAAAAFIQPNATTGVPANCAALDRFDNFAGNTSPTRFPNTGAQMMLPPRGGLNGRASLIRPDNGSNFTFSAIALDGWSNVVAYGPAGDPSPTLADAAPATSLLFTPDGAVASAWSSGRDAVSAVLMRQSLQNEFILDTGTLSQTDWIVTFPTKRHHTGAATIGARAPFANAFASDASGSCDPYTTSVFNRESRTLDPAVTATGGVLCWAANAVPFASSALSGALNNDPLLASVRLFVSNATTTLGSLVSPGFGTGQGPNGTLSMQFVGNAASLIPSSATLLPAGGSPRPVPGRLFGLPAVGFMMHNYQNNGVQSRYGGVIEHKSTTVME